MSVIIKIVLSVLLAIVRFAAIYFLSLKIIEFIQEKKYQKWYKKA